MDFQFISIHFRLLGSSFVETLYARVCVCVCMGEGGAYTRYKYPAIM